jgi:hypothetical protein
VLKSIGASGVPFPPDNRGYFLRAYATGSGHARGRVEDQDNEDKKAFRPCFSPAEWRASPAFHEESSEIRAIGEDRQPVGESIETA